MKLLIIGGTGFIGTHLVEQSLQAGHEVAVFYRGEQDRELSKEVQSITGDRDELAKYQGEFKSFNPDVVIDLIAYTKSHAKSTLQVFRGIADRRIAISSCDVYRNYDGFRGEYTGSADPTPLDEDAPLRESRFPYRGTEGLDFAYTKNYDKILVEEEVIGDAELPGTVLRLPKLYGPGDYQAQFYSYFKRMNDNRPYILLPKEEAGFRWTHGCIENIASVILDVAENDNTSGEIYNLGEAQTPSLEERIRCWADIMNWDGDIVTVPKQRLPETLQKPFNYVYDLEVDTAKIRCAIEIPDGYSQKESVAKTAEWYASSSSFDQDYSDQYKAEDQFLNKK